MSKRQPHRMQRLTLEVNAFWIHSGRQIAPLTDERVATQRGLNANLIAPTRLQPDIEEAGVFQQLEHVILADRVLRIVVARTRRSLDQCLCIPDEPIAPGTIRQMDVSAYYRPVDSLGLASLELLHKRMPRVGVFRKDDQSGRVLVDSVNDERPFLTVRPEPRDEQIEHRWNGRVPLERHRQQAGRLVDDDAPLILVNDVELSRLSRAVS